MAGKYLGDAFDIHGGGIDLRFPHHENELAQSTAAGPAFATLWMHNAWITTSGEKMSKSLGNSMLVTEVVKRVRGRSSCATTWWRRTTAPTSSSPYEALDEAAAGFARIENFLDAGESAAGRRSRRPARPGRVRRSHGRRPGHAGGARGDPRDGARGQQLLADGDSRELRGCGVRGARDARDPRPRPVRRALVERRLVRAEARLRAPSTHSCASLLEQRAEAACARTSRPPTPSATSSRTPVSRSRTPRRAPAGL